MGRHRHRPDEVDLRRGRRRVQQPQLLPGHHLRVAGRVGPDGPVGGRIQPSRVPVRWFGRSAGLEFGKKLSRELPNVNLLQMPEGHDVNSIIVQEGKEWIDERIRKCLGE